MSESVFVPAEDLQFVKLHDAKPGQLFWSVDRESTLFWIVENEGHPAAVFLSGPYAGHAFDLAKNASWSGVLVGPVELKVDVTSAHNGVKRDVGLLVANGVVSTSAKMNVRGFDEWVPVTVGKATTVAGQSLYFTRWSLGWVEDDKWRELARCQAANGWPASSTESTQRLSHPCQQVLE